MLAAILILMLKKLNKKYQPLSNMQCTKRILTKGIVLIALSVLSFTQTSSAQENELSLAVWKNDARIGTINIKKSIDNSTVVYDLSTQITAKALFTFEIYGKEKAVFENGIMVYSSVYRTLNDNEKEKKNVRLVNGKYYLSKGNKKKELKLENIQYNLLALYFGEPDPNVIQVYCDNQNSMAKVKPMGKGIYKVVFADGNHSIFYYENGNCTKVDAVNTFYKVRLMPTIKS